MGRPVIDLGHKRALLVFLHRTAVEERFGITPRSARPVPGRA